MSKTIVVGDLHGKWEVAEKALVTGLPVIFIGDYLDSFDRSISDQIKTFDTVINAVKDKKARALIGNHEVSYLFTEMRCSGWRMATQAHIMTRMSDFKYLEYWIQTEGFLISHAGISNRLLENQNITLNKYLELQDYFQVGDARSGLEKYPCEAGGLLWCDWRHEFDPVPGVMQIMGHTAAPDFRNKGNGKSKSYCIDCLDSIHKVAIIEDGNLRPVLLENLPY